MSKYELRTGVNMCPAAADSSCSDLQREICSTTVAMSQESADRLNQIRDSHVSEFQRRRDDFLNKLGVSLEGHAANDDIKASRDRIAENITKMGQVFEDVSVVVCSGPKGRFIPKCTAKVTKVQN